MKKLLIFLLILSLLLISCKKQEPTGGAIVNIEEESACEDTDGGINPEVRGMIYIGDKDYGDACVSGLLIEYYCDGDIVANQNIRCPGECSSGKCI